MQLASYGGVAGSDRDRVVLDGHANKDPLPTFQLDPEGKIVPAVAPVPSANAPTAWTGGVRATSPATSFGR